MGQKHLCLLVFLCLPQLSLAASPVIYGDDNRVQVYDAPARLQSWARSTAIMFDIKSFKKTGFEWLLDQRSQKQSLDEGQSYCPEVKFTDEPATGICSGFLIAPDLLVTAGHCAAIKDFCARFKWVFDFQVDPKTGKAGVDVPDGNIYSCKKVISTALLVAENVDFALVQLERSVVGREPLPYRSSKKISKESQLVLIGGPSGLPLKIAQGGTVRENKHPFYFSANLDSFQGNSGSGVFDEASGTIEGILVRGETDYEVDNSRNCTQPKKCAMGECRGEDVSRISSIVEIATRRLFEKAIATDDLNKLDELLALNSWLDFPDAHGRTLLMKAAELNKKEAVQKLLMKGASAGAMDKNGKNALAYAQELGHVETAEMIASGGFVWIPTIDFSQLVGPVKPKI
jgi:V8-like Glu-specific endopeptidase